MSKKIEKLTLIITFFLLWNCYNPFAPKLQKTLKLDQLITDQKSPEDVLINFKYENRNIHNNTSSNFTGDLHNTEFRNCFSKIILQGI